MYDLKTITKPTSQASYYASRLVHHVCIVLSNSLVSLVALVSEALRPLATEVQYAHAHLATPEPGLPLAVDVAILFVREINYKKTHHPF